MSEQAKTMGQVAAEAHRLRAGGEHSGSAWPACACNTCECEKSAWESAAAAVIAAHEAAKWRPMSEQDEVPTKALLAYEVDSVRYVTACVIDWRYDDSQPERYISDDDDEPIFVPWALIALAWQHMPKPPEVPR